MDEDEGVIGAVEQSEKLAESGSAHVYTLLTALEPENLQPSCYYLQAISKMQ